MSALHRCRRGGKRRFRDHHEAVRALHQAGNARRRAFDEGQDSTRRETRVYSCDACHGWHMTSQHKRVDAPSGAE